MHIMPDNVKHTELLALTAQVASAHLSRAPASKDDIPAIIETIYNTFKNLGHQNTSRTTRPPAVPVADSITSEFLICLEDGKKLKMLKRYLKTAFGMTPEQYRERWGLSPDYPMVAPGYAEKRSDLAKDIGLGTKARRKKKL